MGQHGSGDKKQELRRTLLKLWHQSHLEDLKQRLLGPAPEFLIQALS